jgi:hypothetical protein
MSRKPENKFMDAVHDKLPPEAMYHMKITPAFTSGEFDTMYEGHSFDLWVEYKFIRDLPKRDTTPIDIIGMMSDNQIKWGRRRRKAANEHRLPPYLCVGCKLNGFYHGLFVQFTPGMLPISTKAFKDQVVCARTVGKQIMELVS